MPSQPIVPYALETASGRVEDLYTVTHGYRRQGMRPFCTWFAVLLFAMAACAGEIPEKVRHNVRVINSAEAKEVSTPKSCNFASGNCLSNRG